MNPNSISTRYKIDLSGVRQQKLAVEMSLEQENHDPIDLLMPAFSPGSPTRSQGHPSDVADVTARTAEGKPLDVERYEKGWRVHPDTKGPVVVNYTVKADDFSHVGNSLTDQQAYLHGPAMLMYQADQEKFHPSTVEFVNLPDPEWKSHAALPAVESASHTFYASSYDDLADTNFKFGHTEVAEDMIEGTRVIVNQQGEAPWTKGGVSAEETLDDFRKLYRVFLENFGEFPSERYVNAPPRPDGVEQNDKYLINKHYLHEKSRAGSLEHYHGQELTFKKVHQRTIGEVYNGEPRSYERGVLSHELVHKMLAKLVRHDGIDSADLQNARPTDGLWLTEGSTDWMGMMMERQADLLPEDQFVHQMTHIFDRYQREFQAEPMSPTENSLEALLGNSSYYNKGAVASFVLDLEIRRLTDGEKSYIDVLRSLKDEFGGTDKFHTLDDVQRLTEKVVGEENKDAVGAFFDDHMRDRKPFNFDRALGAVGMKLVERTDAWEPTALALGSDGTALAVDESGVPSVQASTDSNKKAVEIPTLGLNMRKSGERFKVYKITEGGPAAEAGLGARSGEKAQKVELVYDNGRRVDLSRPLQPGGTEEGKLTGVEFSFENEDRFTGESKKVSYLVKPRPASRWFVEQDEEAAPEQLKLRDSWLGSYVR